MIDRMPREGYGYGIIRLTWRLTEVSTELEVFRLIEISDTQGRLKDMGILDQIKRGLRLPDDYTVLAVYVEPPRLTWCVLIEAPGVPLPNEGEELPVLTPIYEARFPDGTPKSREVVLLRVDVATDPYMALRVD